MELTFEERQEASNKNLRAQRAREAARRYPERDTAVPPEAYVTNPLRVEGEAADEFCRWLCRRFGSISCAWRTAMDPDGGLVSNVSRAEFFDICRCMGYHHSLKNLWEDLDFNGTSHISLESLDPEAWEALDAFRRFLAAQHCDLSSAWTSGFKA